MHKSCPELSHPVDTLYHIAPCMAITLVPFAVVLETKRLIQSQLFFGGSTDAGTMALILMIAGSCIAFGLVMSEFLLVRTTSSVTLSVAGICKEIFTILLAVLVSGEHLTLLNVAGLVVSIIGIIYYNVLKLRGVLVAGHGHGQRDSPSRLYMKLEKIDDDDDDEVEGRHTRRENIELRVLR